MMTQVTKYQFGVEIYFFIHIIISSAQGIFYSSWRLRTQKEMKIMKSRYPIKGPHLRLLFAVLLCMVFFMGNGDDDDCTSSSAKGTLVVNNASGYELTVKVQGAKGESGPWNYTAASGDSQSFSVKPDTYTASYAETTFRAQSQNKSTNVEKGKTGTINMTLD